MVNGEWGMLNGGGPLFCMSWQFGLHCILLPAGGIIEKPVKNRERCRTISTPAKPMPQRKSDIYGKQVGGGKCLGQPHSSGQTYTTSWLFCYLNWIPSRVPIRILHQLLAEDFQIGWVQLPHWTPGGRLSFTILTKPNGKSLQSKLSIYCSRELLLDYGNIPTE